MGDGLLGSDAAERVGGPLAERAAGGRQHEALDRVARLADEALEQRRVLRVDRDDDGAGPRGGGLDERAGHDERLLVGEGDRLAGLGGRERGAEAGGPDDGRDHDVDLGRLGELTDGVGAGGDLDVGVGEGVAEVPEAGLVGDHGALGTNAAGLLREFLPARAGRERRDPELVREERGDLERLDADRARRAEHGHGAGGVPAWRGRSEVGEHRRRRTNGASGALTADHPR